MKIVFVSGFLNNHLLPFCESLAETNEFYFVATENRTDYSFNRASIERDYVIPYYEKQRQAIAIGFIVNCDIAIFGGSSDELLEIRKRTGKITFIYTERLFKKGTWRRMIPSIRKVYSQRFLSNSYNTFVLCAGAFVASDLALLGFDTSRCFKFGYFPNIVSFDVEDCVNAKHSKDQLALLYVGRLVKLKRVQDVIKCCVFLKKAGYAFQLTIVGDGPEKKKLANLANRLKIQDYVDFVGELSISDVFSRMVISNVLFLPSNQCEGWGAVINEALRCGCYVLASNTCGASHYLIQSGINGDIYEPGNIKKMYESLMNYIYVSDKSSICCKAIDTIESEWNARIAAERLVAVSKALINHRDLPKYESGPLSIA